MRPAPDVQDEVALADRSKDPAGAGSSMGADYARRPPPTDPLSLASVERGTQDTATPVEQARRRRDWYHTLELAPDLVTEGWFDLRPYVDRYGLPERMDGMRALEVGTWDGFWAFEMERRGAEVLALDLDDEGELDYPPRRRPERFSDEPGARASTWPRRSWARA